QAPSTPHPPPPPKQRSSTPRSIIAIKQHNKEVAVGEVSSNGEGWKGEGKGISTQQVQGMGPGVQSRIISRAIPSEGERGEGLKHAVGVCFVVAKNKIPPPASQQEAKQRPDGGCRKVW